MAVEKAQTGFNMENVPVERCKVLSSVRGVRPVIEPFHLEFDYEQK